MLSKRRQRILGVAMIVFAALTLVLGITKPNPFAHHHRYWARFDSVQGLGSIDRDVRIAGVKVGTVGDVKRVGDDALVQIDLSEDFPIHSDAHAAMRPHTLFEGSNFIDLSPGSPSAPRLAEGDTIPRSQTTNYVTLDKALRVLRPQIRNNLRGLAKAGDKTLRGEAIKGVQRTLKGAPTLTQALAPAMRAAQGPNRRELVGAVRGAARTVTALASKEDQLIPLTRRLNNTTAGLTIDAGRPLDAALQELPGTLRELYRTAPSLTATIQRLDKLAYLTNPALPDLTAATAALTPTLRDAIPVLRDATPLIRNTRLVAQRLARARGGLVTMFRLLKKPLLGFKAALALINSTTPLGAPAYRQLIAGGFGGGDAIFRSYQTTAQNPNAPGHTLRTNVYFDPNLLSGLGGILGGGGLPKEQSAGKPTTSCDTVAEVSKRAARNLKAYGGCR